MPPKKEEGRQLVAERLRVWETSGFLGNRLPKALDPPASEDRLPLKPLSAGLAEKRERGPGPGGGGSDRLVPDGCLIGA